MQAAHRGTFILDQMRQEFQALTLTNHELPASQCRKQRPDGHASSNPNLSVTCSKSSTLAVYRVGMNGITPDGIALFAGMIFRAGFVAIAFWLLQR